MALVVWLLLLAAGAQAQEQIKPLKSTGSCGRCHVASVLEWSVSKHQGSSIDCIACHGVSQGHVIDERNNVKPERIPRASAIAGLCATCHAAGCPKTKHKAACQDCHHPHALLNPNAGKALQDQRLNELSAKWDARKRFLDEGERFFAKGNWQQARDAFARANAPSRVRACERRLNPNLPGFEIMGNDFDAATGLARRVKVAGTGIEMLLAPGGEIDIGSDRLKDASPVHTVRVEPFYLGRLELLAKDSQLPVTNLSWQDCQEYVGKLNATIAGGAFRLPTEAEWEYAARAGKPFDAASLTRIAWFRQGRDTEGPKPAGTREANAWGFQDMLGNVWEWCSSASRPYPYDAGDGRESADPTALRVLRGGGFADSIDYLDPAMRHAERPGRRYKWNGMRLARSVPK